MKYITQLKSEDMNRMIKVSRIKAGNGIKLDFDGDGVVVSIDKEALKYMIWSYIKGAVRSSVTGGVLIQPTLTDLKDVPMTPV